jgi:protein-tyrosine phosphatase
VHCSAGKDRTGFVIAMLLLALDVPEPFIRADYLASRNWPGAELHRASLEERLRPVVAPEELRAAVDAVLDVRDAYLDAALAVVQDEFGSIGRYLEAAAGLSGHRVERLREKLLA